MSTTRFYTFRVFVEKPSGSGLVLYRAKTARQARELAESDGYDVVRVVKETEQE